MEAEKFETWAILELMGHRRLGGFVSTGTGSLPELIRIDIHEGNGDGEKKSTQFYGPKSVYCLTPCDEPAARAVAEGFHRPIYRYTPPVLEAGGGHDFADDDIGTIEDFDGADPGEREF